MGYNIITEFEELYRKDLLIVKALNSCKDFKDPEDQKNFQAMKLRIIFYLARNNYLLRKMFVEEMPYTFTDALNIDGFDMKRYFDVLKKYPSLLRTNGKEALRSLLISLNTQDPERFGMEEFPTLADFE